MSKNTYEVYIDGDFFDVVDATDKADALEQVFDRLDGHVGEMHAELVEADTGLDDYCDLGICPVCNGSGEGQHEGTRCYHCGGSGEA